MPDPLPWLDPPYQFFDPPADVPVILPVLRYQGGLSNRPTLTPPYSAVKVTIRFHLTGPGSWGLRPYADFTHRLLIQRVVQIYDELVAEASALPVFERLALLQKVLPGGEIPLRLQLVRRGAHPESSYEVDVLEA